MIVDRTDSRGDAAFVVSPLVVAAVLILAVGPLFGPVARWLDGRYEIDTATIVLVGLFAVILGAAALALWSIERRSAPGTDTARVFGLQRSTSRAALAVGLLVGVLWGLLGRFGIYQYETDPDLSITVIGAATAVLGAAVGLAEDMVTRAYLMNAWQRRGRSPWLQALGSAGVFALYHALWIGTVEGTAGSLIFSFLYGLILAGLFLWGGRSLWPVVLGHSTALLVGEPFLTQVLLHSLR